MSLVFCIMYLLSPTWRYVILFLFVFLVRGKKSPPPQSTRNHPVSSGNSYCSHERMIVISSKNFVLNLYGSFNLIYCQILDMDNL